MKRKMKPIAPCSLVISTYNWPQALDLCLQSVTRQTLMPAEIIIADDGSSSETEQLLNYYRETYALNLIHIWQPDEGFRLARIRNKALAAATFDYIIQADGDLILHPLFIADHLRLRKKGHFITGSRVMLSEFTTSRLFRHRSIDIRKYGSDNSNLLNSLRSPLLSSVLADHYKQPGRNRFYVKGCNMAFWKEDLLAINGYNEAFTEWGAEDSELAVRLIHHGIRKRFLKFGGIVFHLHHRLACRSGEKRNFEMMAETIRQKHIRIHAGIDQHLENIPV